ncbi:MAG TPA: hypothetical protein VHB21_23125 [Minicystis sp.]|nr:hypothetical protein [Minicystis sp.]
MHNAAALGLAAALVTCAAVASADGPAGPAKAPTTVATVVIHAHPPRPNVAVTVARRPLDDAMRELRKPFLERIAKAAEKAPF